MLHQITAALAVVSERSVTERKREKGRERVRERERLIERDKPHFADLPTSRTSEKQKKHWKGRGVGVMGNQKSCQCLESHASSDETLTVQ